MSSFRLSILFKSMRQLGFEPLALNALYKLGLKTGYYKGIENKKHPAGRLTSTRLFSLPNRVELLKILGNHGRSALLTEADEIAAGKVRLFGGEFVGLWLTGDWPLDHWTEYETGRIKLDGDIKFIWEPARFGWAFILGRAYYIAQDDKYAQAFWQHFDAFNEGNPPSLGPHWMNGQEVALRLMALVWAAHVFETAAASSPERRGRLLRSISQHAARIPPTLIYARAQNNNHLVGEAAALYTAGLFFDHARWRAVGWRWFNWAVRRQISEYGEYIQHSTNYHRLMLQAALWVHTIKKDDWPHATSQALRRAAHWLFSMLDPVSGRTPNLGSNDGALIFPLTVCPFADYRPTVQAAARAFLNTQMPSGVWDEACAWLGLTPVEKTYQPEHYLSDNLRGRESWAYLRASRFRSRLAHMDQLHFDLWRRGQNIAQDAGAYLYNAEPPWDNPLTTTRVHNTVTVDGRDQMTRAGRFLTLDWFPAYSQTVFERDETILQQVRAYHKGYHRLGVRHDRTVTVYAEERWQVEDRLMARDSSLHIYRLHWLLLDGEWKIEESESGVGIQIKSLQGSIRLQIHHLACGAGFDASLARAGELLYGRRDLLPFEGWVSPTYGVKIPALSLAVEVKSSQPVHMTSEFTFLS